MSRNFFSLVNQLRPSLPGNACNQVRKWSPASALKMRPDRLVRGEYRVIQEFLEAYWRHFDAPPNPHGVVEIEERHREHLGTTGRERRTTHPPHHRCQPRTTLRA